jgi:DNA-binding Lrp family transcriptional regulator
MKYNFENLDIKIDNTDKKLIFELVRNSRISDSELSRIIHKSKETVRYRLKRLEENKIINGYTIWLDPVLLGFRTAKIYMSLMNKPELQEKFNTRLLGDKRLFWFGRAQGAWNAGATFFVRTNAEFFELKNALFSEFKELIVSSNTAEVVNIGWHDWTFLCKNANDKWRMMFGDENRCELDALEKEILKALYANSRANIASIAHANNTTSAIVSYRIKKLEKQKIIGRYTAKIDHKRLGLEFYKSFLYFSSFTKQEENKLMHYLLNIPEIIHIVKQISPWDMELEIMCESYADYNNIIDSLTKEFPNTIKKIDTAIMNEDYVFPYKNVLFD